MDSYGREMPRGSMIEGQEGATDMPSEMPRGAMTATGAEAGGGTMGEMPPGDMNPSQSGMTPAGFAGAGEMPAGAMVESDGSGGVQVIEIPGLWRVTLTRESG